LCSCVTKIWTPIQNNPLGELARLPFRTTVDEYQERFWALLCHVAPLTPEQLVQLFTAGLPEHIRIDVELLSPPDLNTALTMARAYEHRAQALHWFPQPASSRPAQPVTGAPTTQPARPFKQLTPAEMAKRRKQGLCYNCDEQYACGHHCHRFFYLEVSDYTEEDTSAEDSDTTAVDLVISLHALLGTRSKDTMQLIISIHGHNLIALLESGSTHNFLDAATQHRLGVQLGPSLGRQVTVANGEKVTCQGFAEGILVVIGHDYFAVPCYAIALDSFDVILGVQFLRTLGPILGDFEDLCMAFTRGGRRVLWKGLGSPRSQGHLQTSNALPAGQRTPDD
jgi:hypothetical protein